MATFYAEFGSTEQVFQAAFSSDAGMFADFGSVITVTGNPYEGEYEVTPRLYEQTLATENKTMLNDVTVYEIPITRTTNPTGGLTVLIG